MRRSLDELLDRIRTVPTSGAGDRRLVSMLRQDAPHFRGLSTGEADKVRGQILPLQLHLPICANSLLV